MMAQLLPEQFYNLVCSQCRKYLSVHPIKVYPNGEMKCGRCNNANDGGVLSIGNKLVRNGLFKCINRYEGCRALLLPENVSRHEEKCTTSGYECPNCPRKCTRSAYGIVQHFDFAHADSVLKSKIFRIKYDGYKLKNRLLYIESELVFIIFVEIVEDIMYLTATLLTDVSNVFHKFILRHETITETETKPCVPLQYFICDFFEVPLKPSEPAEFECELVLDLSKAPLYTFHLFSLKADNETQTQSTGTCQSTQAIPIDDVPKLVLTEMFLENYPEFKITPCGTAVFKSNGPRFELTCVNCKHFTGNSVHVCKRKHIFCWDCKSWCGICSSSSIFWDEQRSSMNEMLLLPCRWKCGQNINGRGLREHEKRCEKFVVNCPLCSSLNEFTCLEAHIREHRRNANILDSPSLTQFLKSDADEIFFLQNFCLVYAKFEKRNADFRITMIKSGRIFDGGKFVIVNHDGICRDAELVSIDTFPKIHLLMPVKAVGEEFAICPSVYDRNRIHRGNYIFRGNLNRRGNRIFRGNQNFRRNRS